MKDFKELIARPRMIALYASLIIDGFIAIFEILYSNIDEHYDPLPEGERREYTRVDYVRISEPFEVTFSAVDNDSIVRNAVASLDEEERKLRSELGRKLAALQDRKNQLLSLTHETQS